jgi:hypothetical protein
VGEQTAEVPCVLRWQGGGEKIGRLTVPVASRIPNLPRGFGYGYEAVRIMANMLTS